jgi:hypothetical protein
MEFTMTGFSEESGVRRFKFKGTLVNRTFREYSVDTDVTLARKYGIGLQELPLLCRRLLEKDPEGVEPIVVFTEALMREHSDHCAAEDKAALERRRAHKRPNTARLGEHWRGPQAPQ